jgi:hypothetical protein
VTPLERWSGHSNRQEATIEQVLSRCPSFRANAISNCPAPKRCDASFERPEFYLREAPPDPDQITPIRKSSQAGRIRPGSRVGAAAGKGGKRQIESIRSLFGENISEDRNSVMIQRWDVAQNVYRFTLGQDLPAGEYAFAEILPTESISMYGISVDRKAADATAKKR